MNRDSGKKPENSDMETDEKTLRDLDKKKSSKKFGELAAELMQQQGHIPMQQQGYASADLEIPILNEDPDLPPLPTNKDQPPLGLETPAMATADKGHNKSPTRLAITRGKILQAENNHTHESRQRREKEADYTKAKVPCAECLSQETQELETNSIVGDKQKENVSEADKADYTKDTAVSASTHAPQVPAATKPTEGGEGFGEDQADSINTDAVLLPTQALGSFDLGTPEFSQVSDPAPS
jgi:hypothetical protein